MHPSDRQLNKPQNFSGQNLRGRSFKGRKDLAGADFSYADIRGTDFTNANLRGANFSHATAGLQRHWVIGLVVLVLLLSVLSGFAAALSDVWATYFPKAIQENTISPGVIVFIVFILVVVFAIVIVHQGWEAALGAGAVVGAVTVVAAGFEAVDVARVGFGAVVSALVGALAVAVGGAVAWADGWSSICVLAWSGSIAWTLTVAGNGVYFGANWLLTIAWAGSEVVVIASLGTYLGWRLVTKNQTFALVQQVVVAVIAIGGTSFRGADLTDADFTQATLKSTNFRKANVTRTCWFNAKKLDHALVETTYLEKSQVQELVITKEGQDKNCDGLRLRGLNLHGANLADASFIRADLSEANLQDATLLRAKLKQTQLDGTNLTGACLTGACIEDWGITPETKLDGVQCEYVFTRLATKDDPNPHRKPDNWAETFEDGDFADFIAPLVKTLLDLYHNQQINPRAVQLAFSELVENNPGAELSVISVETRGKNYDKLLIRAKVAEDANTSELSAEYFSNYYRYQTLPPEALRSLLAEKDKTILMLAGQVDNALKTAIERPSIYAQTYQNRGNIMSESKGNEISISGVTGSIGGVVGGDGVAGQNMTGVAGVVSGNVTQSIGQLQDSDELEAPKLADLLKQLQAAIEADANLSAEDKAEALEQVKAIAQAGQNPKEGAMQKTAKSAIRMLKGIIADLPAVATLVEAGNKLLPAIAQLFAL